METRRNAEDWSNHISVSFMNMIEEPMETKSIYLPEKLSFEQIEKALNTYINFKNSKRKGRKPKYHPDFPPSKWLLDHDLKQKNISRATYNKYLKLVPQTKNEL